MAYRTSNNNKKTLVELGIGAVILAAAALLFFKGCNGGKGGIDSETKEAIAKIAANVDSIKEESRLNADTLKVYSKDIHAITTRTEKKVDAVQQTADSILTKVDSCCNCNTKPEVKPVAKPVVKDTTVVTPKKEPVVTPKKEPVVTPKDTVVAPKVEPVVQDTVARAQAKVMRVYCRWASENKYR